MNIILNGQQAQTEASSLLTLVAEITGRRLLDSGQPADGSRLGIAVAVNAEVVPRSNWANQTIKPGDDVELVTAVQGG